MEFIGVRTASISSQPGRIFSTIIRLALALIGLVIAVPVMLIGGIVSYFYLRRRIRQAQEASRAEMHRADMYRSDAQRSDVIDAEYTVIDQR